MNRRKFQWLVPMLLIAAILAGCAGQTGSGSTTPAGSDPASQEKVKVTLVQAHTNVGVGEDIWVYAVPYYMGYFDEEGIEVELQGANGGGAAAQLLVSGSAQFATAAPEIAMTLREQGSNVKSVYNIRKRGGFAIAVLPDSPIETLADLKGATIGVSGLGSAAVAIVKESLADLDIDESEYVIVAAGTGAQAATALQNANVDALALWDAAYGAMENAGIVMRYIDLPIVDQLAGLSLLSTDEFIASHPETVGGLCRAITKGLVYTMANPEAAVKILHEVFPETKSATLSDEEAVANDVNVINIYMANAFKGPESPWGYNFPVRWEFTRSYYLAQGMFTDPKPAVEHYTNEFIDTCNDFDPAPIEAAAKAGG